MSRPRAIEKECTCEYCGTQFISKRKNRFCSILCCVRKANRAVHVGPHTKLCQVCGKEFEAKGTGQKNCSRECWKEAEKARYLRVRYYIKATRVEPISKIRVFNEYGWHCAMCGIPTPRTAMGTYQRNEPTLDHIIPLSKQGTHTYDNLQLLCRNCNCAVKNNRIGQGYVNHQLVKTL